MRCVLVWSVTVLACQPPERVYFEVASAGAASVASGGNAARGAEASGGVPTETGGAPAATGGAPRAPTGGAAAHTGGAAAHTGGAATVAGAGVGPASPAPAALTAEQQFEVCAEYMLAQCRRLDDCSRLRYEECLGIAIPLCPHFFFASSTHATPEAIRTCTEKWRGATCEELDAPDFPGCELAPGDRRIGQPCSFNTQCETRHCDRSKGACGRCVPEVGEGQECGAEIAACGGGLACTTTCVTNGVDCKDVCTEPAPPSATPPAAPLATGQPCVSQHQCLEGYCDAETKVCTLSPVVGMPCALEARYLGRACAGAGVCDASFDVPLCVNPALLAEPCTANSEGPGLYDSTCQAGLACACTDRTCSTGARQCSRILPPGANCDFAGAWCAEPTECKNGRCEALLRPDPDVEACRP